MSNELQQSSSHIVRLCTTQQRKLAIYFMRLFQPLIHASYPASLHNIPNPFHKCSNCRPHCQLTNSTTWLFMTSHYSISGLQGVFLEIMGCRDILITSALSLNTLCTVKPDTFLGAKETAAAAYIHNSRNVPLTRIVLLQRYIINHCYYYHCCCQY